MKISRDNNFDLIRLIAAFQVLLWHGSVHFNITDKIYGFLTVIFHFPGVPIFFTISGFLISYSLERNNFNLKQYFKNRALRIFPALWACTIITTFLLLSFDKITVFIDFISWFFAQITFFQFYASNSLKNWGIGHPNGSLWSIAVELQFYFVLPIVLYLINIPKSRLYSNLVLLVVFLFSILIKYLIQTNTFILEHVFYEKLLNNTIIIYLHFFLTGIGIYKNFDWILVYLKEKVIVWLVLYALYVLVFQVWLKYYTGPYEISIWGIIANTLLSCLTMSFAFSFTNLSKILLHENDISYGMYIYHMPILNTLLSLGYKDSIWNLAALIGITTLFAYLSWIFIERKILKMKM